MQRRKLIAVLAVAPAIWPRAPRAQQTYRVGLLFPGATPTEKVPQVQSVLRGLAKAGYVLGKNLTLEGRGAGARPTASAVVADLIDIAAERRRLEKDLAAAEKELAGTTGKLGNDAFLAKAPADVVEKIRGRQQLAREEVDRITARLASLR